MMKIINYVVVLMILVGGSQLSHGENLNCKFNLDHYHLIGSMYQCEVTTLDNTHNNLVITEYTGRHMANENNNNVRAIYIHDTNTKYIPRNLGLLFNLSALAMWNAKLIEIKSTDFHGMQELEYLGLFNNKLTSVPSDVFDTLTKLRTISLDVNQIEELPNGIFANNLQLEYINFAKNNIKYLGAELLTSLRSLTFVRLGGNICINKEYDGATQIDQLKEDIKTKCTNPNEVPATTTATTTTLNPMEVKLIEMQEKISKLEKELRTRIMNEDALTNERDALKKKLREAKELLQRNEDALTNERDALRKELREVKELLQRNEDALTNERDALRKELREAKELLQRNEDALTKTQELIAKLSNCEAMKSSFNITCKFQMTNEGYSCDARDLVINQKHMELNEVSGTHLMSNTNEDVTELIIANSSMTFWSNNIFKVFPALQTLVIQKAQLKELSKGDFFNSVTITVLVVHGNDIKSLGDDVFEGAAKHLKRLEMISNQIEKVSAGTFHGLKQLKMLSLKDNLITELQLGTFKDVVMLENLMLSGNKIKFLNGKLFEFNVKLMKLAVDHNEVREIGEDILNYSVALKDVDFNGNDCIYQEFKGSEIYELKFHIKHCCKNPKQALNVYNCGHRGWD